MRFCGQCSLRCDSEPIPTKASFESKCTDRCRGRDFTRRVAELYECGNPLEVFGPSKSKSMRMTANGRSKRTIIIGGAPLPDVIDEGMIRCVVHGFYAEIRRDELLGPIFRDRIEPNDWPRHLAKICDFWSATLLRSSRYEGRPLPPHLAISGLGEAHFRRWLKLFRAQRCVASARPRLRRCSWIARCASLTVSVSRSPSAVARPRWA